MDDIKLMRKIAKKYKIKLYFVKHGDKFCKANGEHNYIDGSYCTGGEIWIGIYTDEELKLASFFHEMGHLIDPVDWSISISTTKHDIECWAWIIGFKLAETYGITFSKRAKRWAKKQSDSYIGYEIAHLE